MNRALFLLLAAFGTCTACTHVQRAPALSNPQTPPPSTQPTAQNNMKQFLSRTADVTWDVVSAPVRMVTPQKKPPPPPPATYQAPEAIIIIPQAEGGEGLLGVATQPATTLPK